MHRGRLAYMRPTALHGRDARGERPLPRVTRDKAQQSAQASTISHQDAATHECRTADG